MDSLTICGNTHPGKRRKENQDAFIFRQLWSGDKALLAVVDGVGGYSGGEKAAGIARDCLEQYMQIPRGDTLTMLREAVIFANNRIVEERKTDQQVSEMCCVLTAVVADASEGCLYYAHVGDTRLYRYRDGSLQKLTRDHSIVGIKEDAGEMSELEAMTHPHRNQILREVGSTLHRLDDEDFMDYGREALLPGDRLLLCSDGLTDMVTLNQMSMLLSVNQPLFNKVDNLIALANEMGGTDNITVVLLHYQPASSPARVTTDTPVELLATPVAPGSDPVKRPVQPERSRLLWAALLILLVAGAGWYLSPGKKELISLPGEMIPVRRTDSTAWDSSRAFLAKREYHPAVPGPVVEMRMDTLRITTSQKWEYLQRYTDSSQKILVLLPARKFQQGSPAIDITSSAATPGDTLLIRNLRLKNFETGIRVRVPVFIQTDNLIFENIRYPFSYPAKRDSAHSSVLFMHTLKQ